MSKTDSGRPVMLRMLQQSKKPLAELPAMGTSCERFSAICTESLMEMAQWVEKVVVEQVLQTTVLDPAPAMVTIIATIPEWNERAVCQFDRLLLFRLLDAMYGGDARLRDEAPQRPLTHLERSLALKVAMLLLRDLQSAFAEVCAFTCTSLRFADEQEPDAMASGASELLQINLRTAELRDHIRIGLPLVGLEFARDKLSQGAVESAMDLDPKWSQDFRRNIALTKVRLVASLGGPEMLLSDVAKLRPGSVLDFEGSRLKHVLVEGDGEPLFIGRLGQLKGAFTICIEKAIAARPSSDEGGGV